MFSETTCITVSDTQSIAQYVNLSFNPSLKIRSCKIVAESSFTSSNQPNYSLREEENVAWKHSTQEIGDPKLETWRLRNICLNFHYWVKGYLLRYLDSIVSQIMQFVLCILSPLLDLPSLYLTVAISKLGVKCVLGLVKCAVLYIQWSSVTVSILMFNNLYGISLSISDWCWRLCLLQHSCTCGWILT